MSIELFSIIMVVAVAMVLRAWMSRIEKKLKSLSTDVGHMQNAMIRELGRARSTNVENQEDEIVEYTTNDGQHHILKL